MTQEEKELLLKDICDRIPYGVIGKFKNSNQQIYGIFHDLLEGWQVSGITLMESIDTVKPYLFPLSSMTEEQEKEISKRYNYYHYYGLCVEITNHREGFWDNDNSCLLEDYLWLEDWFNKNHFDYRGLIEKGLAIDATGKNIY